MKMIVPPECQGQIVQVSYGDSCNGILYRRTVDRSDRSESWERAEHVDLFPRCDHDSDCGCWSPQNVEPGGDPDAWEPCAEPVESSFLK